MGPQQVCDHPKGRLTSVEIETGVARYDYFMLAPCPPLGYVIGWLSHQPYAACWVEALPQQWWLPC